MKTTLSIEWMSCEHCVKHVTETLEALTGVKKAKVNLKAGKADIDHADSVSVDALKAAVVEAGFQVPA